MSQSSSSLSGRCHCGAVTWRLSVRPDACLSCNCTICRRYGAIWAYGVLNEDIRIEGETSKYVRNGTGDIEFHFCDHCGCMTHYIAVRPNPKGLHKAAVNLRMCEPDLVEDIPMVRFDGCETFSKQPSENVTVKDKWY